MTVSICITLVSAGRLLTSCSLELSKSVTDARIGEVAKCPKSRASMSGREYDLSLRSLSMWMAAGAPTKFRNYDGFQFDILKLFKLTSPNSLEKLWRTNHSHSFVS